MKSEPCGQITQACFQPVLPLINHWDYVYAIREFNQLKFEVDYPVMDRVLAEMDVVLFGNQSRI